VSTGSGGRLARQWVTVHGRRMHARVAADAPPGAGLPLVLMHGLSVSSLSLLPTAARLAAGRRE
jgi:hypothetical protein